MGKNQNIKLNINTMEKTIKISPDLFKVKSRNTGHQKTRSNKNIKRLLSKIKEHAKQHSTKNSKLNNKSDTLNTNITNFEQHIEYLESIRQKRKKTRSNRPQEQVNLTVPDGLTPIEIKSPPKYGILKGGPTPTMREWKQKTQKNLRLNSYSPYTNQSSSTILDNLSAGLSSTISDNSSGTISSHASTNNILKRKIENKFKLGPGKDKKTTSIFITNRRTRKKIQDDIQILNKASLSHVKSYLKKYNLYKLGSDAPPDLLREIYRSAHLAGKPVINKSSENLIHNFYSS